MKKIINYIITLILISLLCLYFVFSPLFWIKYEVHRPAFLSSAETIVEFNNSLYYYEYTLKNGTFFNETKQKIGKMTTNNDFIFVEVEKQIYMVNKNYEIEYVFKCDSVINSIAASDNYLYCYLGRTYVPKIYVFNILTKEKTILDVAYNSMYTLNGDNNLVHGIDTVYVLSCESTVFYGDSYENKRTIFYKNRYINFVLSQSSNMMTIDDLDNRLFIEIDFGCVLGKIKCYEDDIYFEVVNLIQPNDCMIYGGLCICNLNNTNVFKYSIETNEITNVFSLKEEQFLIDFSNEYNIYYSDGKVYNNNEIIRTVNNIQVGEKIKIKGDKNYQSGAEISWSMFAYYKKELYYLFTNCL